MLLANLILHCFATSWHLLKMHTQWRYVRWWKTHYDDSNDEKSFRGVRDTSILEFFVCYMVTILPPGNNGTRRKLEIKALVFLMDLSLAPWCHLLVIFCWKKNANGNYRSLVVLVGEPTIFGNPTYRHLPIPFLPKTIPVYFLFTQYKLLHLQHSRQISCSNILFRTLNWTFTLDGTRNFSVKDPLHDWCC